MIARVIGKLRRRSATGEGGFTLVELLVVVVIEGIIVSALAGAFYVVLGGSSTVNQSLGQSSDARFAATYIASDARNSSGPETSLTDIATCNDTSPPVAGSPTNIVRFNWNTPNGSGNATINTVDYVLVNGAVLRRLCISSVLQNDIVLANNVGSVAVACSPIADCSGAAVSINVTITELATSTTGTPYTFSLNAAFRKLIGGGAPLTPPVPPSLLISGQGGCGVDVSGGPTGGLKVFGTAYINTADSGGCKAINLTGSGAFVAGATDVLTGGTCSNNNSGAVCPPITKYTTPLADPYASLVAPSEAGRPVQTNACSGSSGSFTAQPGVYTTAFVVQGATTCTMAPGVYIFKAGFDITASGVLNTSGGVLIYVSGGAFTVDGAAKVTLAATTSGQYGGLVVWQAATDTTTFTLAASGLVAFQGAIYVPKATILVNGNAQATKATALVAQNLVIQGSAGIVLGASLVPLSMTIPASAPASWTVGRAYTATTITPAGGDGNYIWSATGLPTGITIGASSGILSGTPTVAVSTSATISLNDQLGDDPATQTFNIVVNAAPTITTASPLPAAELTDPYLAGIATSGGTTPFAWGMTGAPAGLSMSATTGAITGTPTASGTSTVVVTVTDTAGSVVTKSLSLTVAVVPTITTASPLGTAEVTDPYLAGMSATGGTTPYIWSMTGSPAGLSMSTTTGAITGTPTASGAFTVVVTLTDAQGVAVTKNLSLSVTTAPTITTLSLASGEKTIAYSAALAATGGTTPYIWSQTGLPAGLTMSSTTGAITGTPTATASPATVLVTLTDAVGAVTTTDLTLTIIDQPKVVSVALTNGTGTAGTIEAGDKVTIVFSSVMSVAGFCSSWTNNALDQSLVANSDVTVAIANSTNDTLTVTSAVCPSFTIGSINLGSANYVTAATTFKGTGAGVSKINWTSSTHTMVITLGTKATGTVANVTTLTSPIYTTAASIKDGAGAVVGNSPFTVSPAAKRF